MEADEEKEMAEEAAAQWWPSDASFASAAASRRRVLQFLLQAAKRLDLQPLVKYAALSFFAGRFLPALPRKMRSCSGGSRQGVSSWLLEPLRESNLELFALVAIWIASKIHDGRPLSVKSLKALGDRAITDQHFTSRDFADAELVFMEVVEFDIGSSNIAFIYLKELLIQLREISRFGDLLNLDVCMEILDLLYETENTSYLFNCPCRLAASTLVTAYVISVPKQRWEFPILPWVTFATSYQEEEIMEIVARILMHVLKPDANKGRNKRDFNI